MQRVLAGTLVSEPTQNLARLASQTSPGLQHMNSLSVAVDVMREMARSRSHSSLSAAEAGFRVTQLAVLARVKGTYALKGISGSPILSGIMPQQIADLVQLIPATR